MARSTALLATWFGCGRLPWAPGSWGSLAALPFAWVIADFAGRPVLVASAICLFGIGCWAADREANRVGVQDPGWIVVDEVVGQWLTLAVAPLNLAAYLAGFLLFRLFDVWKPWPVNWVERRFGGGFGIMADDVVAAIYAAVILQIGRLLLER